ncbi:stage II sporulation protein M [Hymenobacter sp. BT186]|uniref:Stage II sporulation protein M n=1 Tax=Hymenobacter telluris TaxID=2816474 RepID=A0A939EXC9_9BACT|nr:stage II sporulation protein M [Hymenobacter telluris]MBO0358776.1 stage II sporulation protein M [Hymenobacter telluris]MBW3374802.1 stage II sporulation protein M [Hymenobacter norwichensis]
MREAVFLRQNEARWKQYESTSATDPDELAARFVALTDDLAYAQTFYPASPTTRYLNDLAAKQHQTIYKNKPEQTSRFRDFWARELPLLVARHHTTLAWSLILFTVFTLIGVLSAAYDDTFVRVVLGDAYVNQTLENIKKGDPMAVYKGQSETPMFLMITINNIYVSLVAYVLGATLGLGTVWALFRNGVMLGSFQYFFYQKGVLLPSVLTIWIHGTLEISAIVLAGGAGFVMARGLLFPGTYSRTEAFRQAARDGLKLAIGLVPIFIVAGFLEGFVTRHTEMPMALSLLIIGCSAAFIVWYFIVYPRYLTRQVAAAPAQAAH